MSATDRKLRIGMVLDNRFPPDERVEKEAVSLVQAGFEVLLLCFTFGEDPPKEVYQSIQVRRVYMPHWLYKKLSALVLTLPFYRWFWYWKMKRFVKQEAIDCLHIHDLPLCGVALKIKQKYNIPVIADMHENYPVLIEQEKWANTFWGRLLINKQKWYKVEKKWLAQVDHIICVADEMRNRLEKILAIQKAYTVLPNYIDPEPFLKQQETSSEIEEKFKGKFGVLYYGGFDSMRGIETILEAAKILKDEISHLAIILVGTGTILPELQRLAQRLKIEDVVAFEGWQKQSFLKSYMQATQIVVIPHLKSEQTDNSSPNKLFIAMAFGKPIISTNCRSLEKIIVEADCGLIYPSGDSPALAQQIMALCQNPAECYRLGCNGLRSVKEQHNWSRAVTAVVDLYQRYRSELNRTG